MNAEEAYEELRRLARELELLSSCASLLEWDELTYMPAGGVVNRSNQLAYLAGLEHQKSTDPRLGDLLASLESSGLAREEASPAAANVREWRRRYERLIRLPRALVEELARATSLAQKAWQTARLEDDFERFRPHLSAIIQLKRREAECLRADGSLYDALLQAYEPSIRSSELAALFESLRRALLPIVDKVRGRRGRSRRVSLLRSDYPNDRQRVLVEAVADAIGFDFHRGRLDETVHPFSVRIGPGDCRITTRFIPKDFSEAFFSTLHEVGHALYEQGLDPAHHGTPCGEPASYALHESQARLWENRVGRSRPFWKHFFPLARKVFHETLHAVQVDDFFRAVNHVEPGPDRVRADEATYDLHIIVRFELEQALLDGDLAPAELPGAWTEKYQKLLGVRPKSDVEGCLQDGHWGAGMIGYFPCYTLGNIIAAQLYARALEELPGLEEGFSRGDFSPLLHWLRSRIHRHGKCFPSDDLLRRIAGAPLDHRPLVRSLEEKYAEVYNL